MPFLAPFIPAIIGAGASIAGGVLGSGSKTTTTTPTLNNNMGGQQESLETVLDGMLNPATDPTLAPINSAAEGQINTNFAGLPNQVTSQMAERGFGTSGKVGGGLLGVDSSRLSALGNLSGQMAQLSSQRQMSAAQMIQNMIQMNMGHATTTPSNSLASGLMSGGNALSNLTSLQSLLAALNGGGSAAAGGGSSAGGVDPSLLTQDTEGMTDASGGGWG